MQLKGLNILKMSRKVYKIGVAPSHIFQFQAAHNSGKNSWSRPPPPFSHPPPPLPLLMTGPYAIYYANTVYFQNRPYLFTLDLKLSRFTRNITSVIFTNNKRVIISSFEARGNHASIYGTSVCLTSLYDTNVSPGYQLSKLLWYHKIPHAVSDWTGHVVQNRDSWLC